VNIDLQNIRLKLENRLLRNKTT